MSLRLGVAGSDVGYLVDLGIPSRVTPRSTATPRSSVSSPGPARCSDAAPSAPDAPGPGSIYGPRRHVRAGPLALTTTDRSMLTEVADPVVTPELWGLRRSLASWRFYDGFRVDLDAPVRRPQVGTTRVLADDGADLAAALQTIAEDGRAPLHESVADAFEVLACTSPPRTGCSTRRLPPAGDAPPAAQRRAVRRHAALPAVGRGAAHRRAPPLMVLNEPETSLHPSLLAPLARPVHEAAQRTPLVVVTHSDELVGPPTGRSLRQRRRRQRR